MTKEMLSELYDGPRSILDILYAGHADGVIDGLDVYSRGERVFIGKGLVKYDGHIYRLEEEFCVSGLEAELRGGRDYQLRIEPRDPSPAEGQPQWSHLDLRVREAGGAGASEAPGMAFASFQLNSEKRISISGGERDILLTDFAQWSLWNMLCCPFATKHSVTYHPYVFRAVLRHIQRKKSKTPLDYVILSQILRDDVLEMGFIKQVLQDHGVRIDRETDRVELFYRFARLLDRGSGDATPAVLPTPKDEAPGGLI